MGKVQELASSRVFGRQSISLSSCEPLLCKACLHGKQHRTPVTPSTSPGMLDALHLTLDNCISGDQLESTTSGFIPTYCGSSTTVKYHAGTLFVDHASWFLHFMPHISTSSQEAIGAKHHFELLASHHNCSIKYCHTDNGIVASKDFRSSCIQQRQ
jgi:hypothetical protein